MRRLPLIAAVFALLVTFAFGVALSSVGAAGAEPCPNEAIRTEQHSTYLDDCRAYEMVTPVQKNGADVLANSQQARAAADGGAVEFSSLTNFGDVLGASRATDYVAVRRGDGAWRTHGIYPAQEPGAYFPDIGAGFEARYVGEFSSDLSKGVFMAKTPLTEAPNVDHAVNLYLRTDLLTLGAGIYQLLTDAATDQGTVWDPSVQPAIAGASADFSHVLFESTRSLLPETTGLDRATPKLYEWVNGTLRFLGMVPGPSNHECGGTGPACLPSASQAGQGAMIYAYTLTTISADGRRIIFTVPDPTGGGAVHDGQLYLRDDQGTESLTDDTTTRVNASERATPEASQAAEFWAASADATKVFFTTAGRLTDDDPNNSNDLYRFDLSAPQGERLTRVSVDSEPADNEGADLTNGHYVAGAIGASTDGDSVYFMVSRGQLIAGGSTKVPAGNSGAPGQARIYRWHTGTLREVGGVNASLEQDRILGALQWGQFPKWGRVSPDGRYLTFITQGTDQLLSHYGKPEYDHGNVCDIKTSNGPACLEVYFYDAAANAGAGNLQCASCHPDGVPADANADFFVHFAGGTSLESGLLHNVLSDDGRFVFFSSDDDLLEEDTNGVTDAYAYHTETEHLSLLSSGTSNSRSIFLDASADGRDAFILTRSQLVGKDHDQSNDLYDVRLGGGHPEPLAAAPCDPLAPDSCPASPGSSPGPATTPPTGSAGPGNPTRHRRHKRHRKHNRQAKRERAAHRNQGGSR